MTLYVFSLILGVGLLAFSLLGGDADADATSVADVEALRWLSLRGVSYFAFVFGGVGAALTLTWHGITAPLVALVAAGAGVVVSAIVHATFRYLKRTESGDRGSDDTFIGLTGRVVLPFGESGVGKVLVSRADRSFELLARPFDPAQGEPRSWQQVIVVEMQRGTALVTPYDNGSQDSLPASPE
ncbi:MAG: hypothetical protein KF689_08715 [Gemmatimonadaceae bacterium]|nr:hypothetical protein [Gemmatimonadaceae bacterium]MCW5826323.1 hypothetical protein [Gemmatimonadaceae bacterium]